MSPAPGGLLRSVGAVLAADLRQRLRAPRTWVVMAGLAALMWWCFPALETHYLTVSIDGMRGRYSSAWIGMIEGLIYSMTLSLFGFFLVRGTLVRDFETRAWQLLVATTMSRGAYLFAKWLSHMLLFAMVIAGGLAIGLVLQFVRAEDRHLDLVELLKPIVVITLPSLALTATLAVWFDTIPWLRRSAGNVVFFALWIYLLTLGTTQAPHERGTPMPWPGDPHGMLLAEYELDGHWPVPAPDNEERGVNMGVHRMPQSAVLVDWTHGEVGATALGTRAFWLGAALALLALAVPLLDRCASHLGTPGRAASSGWRLRWLDWLLAPLERWRSGALVAAELRLVLRGRRWWWWLALVGLFGMQAFADPKGMSIAVILSWILFIDVFARLVLREQETRTGGLVFTAASARLKLPVARAVVSIGLAWAVTLPAMLRMALSEPVVALATLAVGASLALWGMAIGALSRNGRPYELLMLVVGYGGMQGAAMINVIVSPEVTLRWHLIGLPIALIAILAVGFMPHREESSS